MLEEELINLVKSKFHQNDKNLIVPLGDDAAVYKPNKLQVITCDQLVEGIHFLSKDSPYLIGKKLIARNLSDIAATGANPLYALLSLASSRSLSWFELLFDGINKIAKAYSIKIIGGDCSSIPANSNVTVLSMTMIGEIKKQDLVNNKSSKIKEGDLIIVSGQLGNSYNSKHHFNFQPRISMGNLLVKLKGLKFITDLSDGLLNDLRKFLLINKGLSVFIQLESLPLRTGATLKSALCEGEDYELLIVIDENYKKDFLALDEVTIIGKIFKNNLQTIFDSKGTNLLSIYKSELFKHKF